nr:hypothetical protein [Candidatus Sigynarchaeum springense]
MLLNVTNKGQDIASTNFFKLPYNNAGKFLISLNAGAFRLLIPDPLAVELRPELAKVSRVQIEQRGETASIILDDGSDNPYTIQTSMNAFDRRPAASDSGREFVFSAWIHGNGENDAIKIFQAPCVYTRP